MYNVQPEEVKRQIISAIADLKTDKALGFLYNAYDEADNWGTRESYSKPSMNIVQWEGKHSINWKEKQIPTQLYCLPIPSIR